MSDYNKKIRTGIASMIEQKVIKPTSSYCQKGIQLDWSDGDISGTLATGKEAWNWLQITVLGGADDE